MHFFSEWLYLLTSPSKPEFWLLVSLVIFFAIVWSKGGFAALGKALDSRAETVRKELDQARALREEAQKLLADYQQRQKVAEAEAAELVATAKAEAERFKAEQIAKVQEFVARRTKLAEQKISQAESHALAEVRAAAADAAVTAASSVLAGDKARANSLMDEALREVRAKLN